MKAENVAGPSGVDQGEVKMQDADDVDNDDDDDDDDDDMEEVS